jgi:molybdopterin/thiamine biosynthesis adenylyltransferase
VADLLALAKRHDTDAHDRLAHLLCNTQGDCTVLLVFPHQGQTIMGALRFTSPRLSSQKQFRERFGRGPLYPPEILAASASQLAALQVVRMHTSLGTHTHVHTRGGAGHSLKGKTVALVGCGSLGSHVAYLLAKAGVGRLYLIDPQTVTRDNIGRSVLGSAHAGLPKAKALAQQLLLQLPHLSIAARTQPWRQIWTTTPRVFLECDLVISTVGHWNTEYDLNVLARRQTGFPPVIFGWIEAHAVAGHALLVHPSLGGCFACGCNDLGVFSRSVTDPAHDAGRRGAGCGDFYQPYGVAEMIPTAALIGQLAIDVVAGHVAESELRSWTSSVSLFKQHGLKISSEWQAAVDKTAFGGGLFQPWPVSPTCRYCR